MKKIIIKRFYNDKNLVQREDITILTNSLPNTQASWQGTGPGVGQRDTTATAFAQTDLPGSTAQTPLQCRHWPSSPSASPKLVLLAVAVAVAVAVAAAFT